MQPYLGSCVGYEGGSDVAHTVYPSIAWSGHFGLFIHQARWSEDMFECLPITHYSDVYGHWKKLSLLRQEAGIWKVRRILDMENIDLMVKIVVRNNMMYSKSFQSKPAGQRSALWQGGGTHGLLWHCEKEVDSTRYLKGLSSLGQHPSNS